MKAKSVGLIGYGSFGELLVELLHGRVKTKVYSRTSGKVPRHLRASIEEVAVCDYVVLAIPLAVYQAVLAELAKLIAPTTVVIDVCSVKVVPCELISELLPHNRLVATHPLFGPQTAAAGLKNLTMVICDEESDAAQALLVDAFCKTLGLKVVHMSADEHDRQMAKVHALTFFVAEALNGLDLESVTLKTPSFAKLTDLASLTEVESRALLDTLQTGNPYAAGVRREFVRKVEEQELGLRRPTDES